MAQYAALRNAYPKMSDAEALRACVDKLPKEGVEAVRARKEAALADAARCEAEERKLLDDQREQALEEEHDERMALLQAEALRIAPANRRELAGRITDWLSTVVADPTLDVQKAATHLVSSLPLMKGSQVDRAVDAAVQAVDRLRKTNPSTSTAQKEQSP